MSRGVETASILGVGVLVTVGLMVLAEWRTHVPESPALFVSSNEAMPMSEKDYVLPEDDVADAPFVPTSPVVDPPANPVEASPSIPTTPPESAPKAESTADAPATSPAVTVPKDEEEVVAEEKTDEGVATDSELEAPDADKEQPSENDESNLVESAESPEMQPNEELQLLEKAHASLTKLHAQLLRIDQSRAQSQVEADRLKKIIGQLPEETRDIVRSWVKDGYLRRVQRADRSDSLQNRSASSVSVSDATVGKRDDTPRDLRALRQRIQGMRSQVGRGADSPLPQQNGSVRSQPIGPGVQSRSP